MTNNEQNFIDFENYYKLQTPKVIKNSEIATPETVGQDFFLHIADKPISKYTPFLSRRAALTEDNTVPRVTVAPTLMGCIMAHGGLDFNFHGSKHTGFYINKICFDYAIKPNNKLVYDSNDTGEYWLVTYNKDTRTYKATEIGKFFILSINYSRDNPSLKLNITTTFYVEISDDISIIFTKDNKLTKGYYKIILNTTNWEEFSIEKITAVDFIKAKAYSVSTLSYKSTPPSYLEWG